MRKRLISGSLLALMALPVVFTTPALSQTPTGSQTSDLEPPDLGLYRRWGPFRVRPGFRVRNVGLDNNIFVDNTDPVSDLRATLAPRIEGLILFGDRAFMTFSEELAYTAYAQNPDQNFLNQLGSARTTVPFGRMGVYADLEFNVINERPVDREDLRPQRKDLGLGFGMIFEVGWRTQLELSRHGTEIAYSDADDPTIGNRLDRDEAVTELQAGHQLRGRTRLLVNAVHTEFDFTGDSLTAPNDPDRDSVQLDVLAGVEFGEGGPLIGRARLGHAQVNLVDPAQPDFSEPIGDLLLRYRIDSRNRLTLRAERSIQFSIFAGQTHYVLGKVGLEALRWINRTLGAEIGAGYGKLSFPDTDLVSSARIDRQRDLFAGLRFRVARNSLGKQIEYTLRYTNYHRESTLAVFDFQRSTLSVGANFGY